MGLEIRALKWFTFSQLLQVILGIYPMRNNCFGNKLHFHISDLYDKSSLGSKFKVELYSDEGFGWLLFSTQKPPEMLQTLETWYPSICFEMPDAWSARELLHIYNFAEIIQRMLASLVVRPHVPRLDILFSRSTSLSRCRWQRQISSPTSHRIQDTSTYERFKPKTNQKLQNLNCKI